MIGVAASLGGSILSSLEIGFDGIVEKTEIASQSPIFALHVLNYEIHG